MAKPMGGDQEILAYLCRDSQPRSQPMVPAKVVAYETGLSVQYIYQLMEGRRTVPIYVFNGILRAAQELYGPDTPLFWAVAKPILPLLFARVSIQLLPHHPSDRLCDAKFAEGTAALLEDMGGIIKTAGRILADGRIDDQDETTVAEFETKAELLAGRLFSLRDSLKIRLAQAVGGRTP